MNFSPISITFFAYLVVMVAVGLVAWRYTKNFNDYILGGRRLGAVVTALSVGASDMSGWLLMGLPGTAFLLTKNNGACGGFLDRAGARRRHIPELALSCQAPEKLFGMLQQFHYRYLHISRTWFRDKTHLIRLISPFSLSYSF